MALVKFFTGTKERLSEHDITPGCVYVITDTSELYFDTPEGKRINVMDSIDYDSMYDYILDRILDDPNAVFKGATETFDGAAGLVPAPEVSHE